MAYNPANLRILAGDRPGPILWKYHSTDAESAFDDASYISDAADKGVQTGDIVFVFDSTNSLTTIAQLTRVSTAASIVPLTATAP